MPPVQSATYKHKLLYVYGSSRLGINRRKPDKKLTDGNDNNGFPINSVYAPEKLKHEIGKKEFELTNHLGNVLTVITDKKHAHDSDGDNLVDYITADLRAVMNYSPFGALIYEWKSKDYRFVFNVEVRKMMKQIFTTIIILTAITAQAQVPSWLQGTWTGKVFQANAAHQQHYTIEITCTDKGCTAKYASLDCSGNWRYVKGTKRKVLFRERIMNNTANCVPDVDVLVRKKKGYIQYKSKAHQSKAYECKGTLTQVKIAVATSHQ